MTHNLEEALTLANRIVVMSRGRVVDDFRLTPAAARDPEALLAAEVNQVRSAVLEHLQAAMNDVETEAAFPEMLGHPTSH